MNKSKATRIAQLLAIRTAGTLRVMREAFCTVVRDRRSSFEERTQGINLECCGDSFCGPCHDYHVTHACVRKPVQNVRHLQNVWLFSTKLDQSKIGNAVK
jgi:hypothetical protein